MPVIYSNNASTSLSAGINNSVTTIPIASASGFPTIGTGEYYFGTISNTANTKIEVVKVTAGTTSLTVTRAQGGTSAQAFDSGDNFQLRVTADTLLAATQTDVKITGGSIATAAIADDAVTAAKLANSINTDIATGPAALPKAGGTMTGNIAHAGDFTLDVGGDINLDADGADINLKDGGTRFGILYNSSSNFVIESSVQDKDIKFLGSDGGSSVTALSLDMSSQGDASFNRHVKLSDTGKLVLGGGDDLLIYHDGSDSYITDTGTGNLVIQTDGNFYVQKEAGGENIIRGDIDGAVTLYHNNVAKIATSAAGATVTGVLTATLQANAIDSDHYTNGSIDTAHIGAEQITEPLMAANSIDSHAYVDGSIDEVHLSDNSVDSRAYVDGSIDLAHISSEAVDEDNLYISNAGSNGQFLSKQTGNNGGLTWATVSSEDFIPNGSVMVFFQAAAPTGWTKVTTQNDKTLRVVSGNGGGTGGDWAMSAGETTSSHGGHVHTGAAHTHTSAAHTHNGASHSHGGGNLAAAAHTISTSQMPSHNHNIPFANNNNGNQYAPENRSNGSGIGTSSTGGGASHSHGMSGNTAAATPGTSGSTTPGATGSTTPGNSGSAGSHTHTIAAPQYIDVIICSKDA